MPQCFCDLCTDNGNNTSGALQSRSACQKHKQKQKMKDALRPKGTPEGENGALGAFHRIALVEALRDCGGGDDHPLFRTVASTQPPADMSEVPAIELDSLVHAFHFPETVDIEERITTYRTPPALLFLFPPGTSTSMYPSSCEYDAWDSGPSGLESTSPGNAETLLHVAFLQSNYEIVVQHLQSIRGVAPDSLLRSARLLLSELQRMERFRQDEWNRQLRLVGSASQRAAAPYIYYDTGMLYHALKPASSAIERKLVTYTDQLRGDHSQHDPAVNIILFLVLVLNMVYQLPFVGCRLILQAAKTLIQLLARGHASISRYHRIDRILSSIPSDFSTARARFHLEPDYVLYACCPSCSALHPALAGTQEANPDPTPGTGASPNRDVVDENRKPVFPDECQYRTTPSGPGCGRRLLRQSSRRPIRTYSYQTFVSWLGRMLLRPDIERYLDASQHPASFHSADSVGDILESQEILNFLAADGEPFLRHCGSEGRYLFSLFVDWFNPRGNSHGGSTYSAGVVFMVCLNLPPDIRYKRENVYLAGVIPGPKAPSLEQVNHFLGPLVRELNQFWSPGVFYSRTAHHSQGRLARCAVLPLVCDLGAGRKLQKSSINNLNKESWPRRDCDTFRRLAEEWKAATTDKRRGQLFKSSGIRYSALLDLPYWRPTRYVVIDTMHNLFLGLFQRHCRRIFGMDFKTVTPDGLDDDTESTPVTVEELVFAQSKASRSSSASSLKGKLNLRLLRAVYQAENLGDPGSLTKSKLAEAILKGREASEQAHPVSRAISEGPNRRLRKGVVLGRDILQHIRADMAKTIYPSYLGRPPAEVGSASAGSLSADQWRTFCLVNLPISLIRIWSTAGTSERRTLLLANFLDLVIAVKRGTTRRLNAEVISSYQHHILSYIQGLRELFPDLDLTPNHHIALHLDEVLKTFGPAHAYWSFPFERLIGLIRQIGSNARPSESFGPQFIQM
ncbi:hypothetical protein ONZ51_g12281 [Trametes cubensis]|uniref:DUF4218 domain-containing protein n=1 Tax=Trametes cubensis TaxID=1111947 RepID=A0AAD7TGA3_9APHY|nr:hypothetical protein ONZ51_g12281 [Trametes cubensis]